jgi:hypothetical protein
MTNTSLEPRTLRRRVYYSGNNLKSAWIVNYLNADGDPRTKQFTIKQDAIDFYQESTNPAIGCVLMADDYDPNADAPGCYLEAIAEARRRHLAGEPPMQFFEPQQAAPASAGRSTRRDASQRQEKTRHAR